MKSKEEILEAHFGSEFYLINIRFWMEKFQAAMQEYADQQTAAMEARIKELEAALEDLADAIPGQNNDQDWWPDELVKSVAAARKLLNK